MKEIKNFLLWIMLVFFLFFREQVTAQDEFRIGGFCFTGSVPLNDIIELDTSGNWVLKANEKTLLEN